MAQPNHLFQPLEGVSTKALEHATDYLRKYATLSEFQLDQIVEFCKVFCINHSGHKNCYNV